MFQDFESPQKPTQSKLVKIASLMPEELKSLRDKGLTVENHEYVISDLSVRLSKSAAAGTNETADQINKLAVDDLLDEDNYSGVNADIADSLREAIRGSDTVDLKNVNFTMDDLDEDSAHKEQQNADEPEPETQKATSEVDDMMSVLMRRQRETNAKYTTAVTDQDRAAILKEAITGEPFKKTFEFLGGQLSIVVSSVSSKQVDEISDLCAAKVSEASLTLDAYNSYRAHLKSAARVYSIVAGSQVVYQRSSQHSVKDLVEAVYTAGPGRSELVRRLIFECDREMNGLLAAILDEAAHGVFTAPAFGEVG